MTLVLRGAVLRGRRLSPGAVAVAGGRVIVASGRGRAVDLPDGWIVAPGMVDLQVNGFAGAEVGDDPDALAAVARALPAAGVTGFCPTLVSRSERAYRRAARALAAAPWPAEGARPLGVHLEGPFLAPARAGAHDPRALRGPAPEAVARLAELLRPRIVTLAPELPGALDAIARLARAGTLVSLGHTDAGAEAGRRAIAAGARMVTHALNAMRGLERREPSALAAALLDRRVRIGLIGDGVHVAAEIAALLARLAGPRLALVSDATAAAGAPPGRNRLAGRSVASDGVRCLAGGRLAGSAAGLDLGPRTLVAAGVPVAAALAAAAVTPRRVLGLPAGLAPGDPADLVVLDEGLVPRLTLAGGRVAHADAALPFAAPDPGERAG